MRDDPPAAEMLDIAASDRPLRQRARGLLDALGRCLPVQATWLALSEPQSNVHQIVASTGLDRSVLDYLGRPSVSREIRPAGLNRGRPPLSLRELPVAAGELPIWAECLIPAGFREGLGVPLAEPGGNYLGMLTLLFTSGEGPSAPLCDQVARLAPIIAKAVSPVRSLLATAGLVRGATAGVVLLQHGGTCPLPGLRGHPLLVPNSLVAVIARRALRSGAVYRSFMWPSPDGSGAASHARVTVIGATDVPTFVLGTLLVTPDADCRGLTARELEVMGLLVAGCSNQQIASRLVVAPRTVAAHMEHILHKLGAPSRTQAAVQAEREGCYVPAVPDGTRRSRR